MLGYRASLLGALALAVNGPPLAAQETLALCNGKDLTGFTTWLRDTKHDDPRGVFSVVNGAIRISGDGYGYLATTRRFRDYDLTLQFRWGDQRGLDRGERHRKALDSGVFLHANGPDGNSHDGEGAYMAAIECNVFEGATGDILLIRGQDAEGRLIAPEVSVQAAPRKDQDGFPFWQAGGELVTLKRWGRVNWFDKSREWQDVRGFRGSNDVEKPAGEWNSLQCLARNGTISILLNGTRVNHVSRAFPREGKILLQCEGAEIYYRNLRVTTWPEDGDDQ